jgi:hypothetical protein
MRSLSLLLLLFPLAACKPKGKPGGVAAGSTLIDPGPAQLPQGWALADHGAGFTLAFPEGWQTKALDQPAIEKFVAAQNENAWGIMNERKADVDFAKCTGMAGIREFFQLTEAFQTRGSTQTMVALREELSSPVDLEEAADRWRDTLWGGSGEPKMKEAIVDLPVGKAKTVSWSSSTLGIAERTMLVLLVDGNAQYTLLFVEEAQDADPAPLTEIMQTFRVKR